MDLGLKGKIAMVAGASRGLGFAVANALAQEGALVSMASHDSAAIVAAAQQKQMHPIRDSPFLTVRSHAYTVTPCSVACEFFCANVALIHSCFA
jgi:NAD(P)-dependent dehydrogenase (short-subunit alcohol dehydrogenase family)